MKVQGRNWLPKTGWASSNATRRRCPAAPSILPKTGWAIAHPTHPPLTPLNHMTGNQVRRNDPTTCLLFFDIIFSMILMQTN
jgi:hypothetical protein